jgi:hypothetical protein
VVVEADQQVGGDADERPADDQEHEVRGQHQQQHREDEEVHLREEAAVVALLVHVLGGVQVDQEAHPGDDQHHQHRQRVDPDRELHLQVPDLDPGPEAGDVEALLGVLPEHPDQDRDGEDEAEEDRAAADDPHQRLRGLLREGAQDQGSEQRQSEDEPGEGGHWRATPSTS